MSRYRILFLAGLLCAVSARTGAQDGTIKVHGHWTIEVRNPDGALASRHEFENALTPGGATRLPKILAGLESVGVWTVRLGHRVGNGTAFGAVAFAENATNALTVEVPESGPRSGALVLRGLNFTAVVDETFDVVATEYARPGPPSSFTMRTLPSPISVVAGQSIAVTVVISFT